MNVPSVYHDHLFGVLKRHLSAINARSVLRAAAQQAGLDPERLTDADCPRMLEALGVGLPFFLGNPVVRARCLSDLQHTGEPAGPVSPAPKPQPAGPPEHADASPSHRAGGPTEPGVAPPSSGHRGHAHVGDAVHLVIRGDVDVVHARTVARQLSADLGFPPQDQARVATVVSELARNIVTYAGRGTVTLKRLGPAPVGIEVVARDKGPGIPDLDAVLAGRYRSQHGMGMGLRGSKNLMDDMTVETARGAGTTVRATRFVR